MQKLSIVALLGLMFVGAGMGCKDSHMPWDKKDKDMATTKAAMMDDCPMCPGIQTAKADGTCPKCGMKVK